MKLFIAFCLLAITIGWLIFAPESRVEYRHAERRTEVPLQEKSERKLFRFKECIITPLADFTVKARVLSRQSYSWDNESQLSPVDLALGWGDMARDDIMDKISVSQSGRWYHWRCDTLPITRKDIETQSCNMHIIPANDKIEDKLSDIRLGHLVELKGMLVEATGKDGWEWRSSLSRSDRGNGSCEVFYVEQIKIKK